MTAMRLVMVTWEDSHALSGVGWMYLDGEYTTAPRVIYSVGWLVHDGDDTKIVVPHRNEETDKYVAQGAGVISIPTRCVVRVDDLVRFAAPGG